jgi:hypothetical protein
VVWSGPLQSVLCWPIQIEGWHIRPFSWKTIKSRENFANDWKV